MNKFVVSLNVAAVAVSAPTLFFSVTVRSRFWRQRYRCEARSPCWPPGNRQVATEHMDGVGVCRRVVRPVGFGVGGVGSPWTVFATDPVALLRTVAWIADVTGAPWRTVTDAKLTLPVPLESPHVAPPVVAPSSRCSAVELGRLSVT